MPYADRPCVDADSHVLELPGWLEAYADPAVRPLLRPADVDRAGPLVGERDQLLRRHDAGDPERRADQRRLRAKGWNALGGCDPGERRRALDLLGYRAQLVLTTFALTQFVDRPGDTNPDRLFGGATALNRAITDFCAEDVRLKPIGYLPWGPPERTAAAAIEAIELGCTALEVPARPDPGGLSPTHRDYDRVWRVLEECDVPFVVRAVGGRKIPAEFHADGRGVTDFMGGQSNTRAKDLLGFSHPAEVFLGSLVLDGVFARFRGLRGAALGYGATWLPSWLARLDVIQRTFSRSEADLALSRRARDYVPGHLFVVPLVGEPLAWLIEQVGPDVLAFGSYYPLPSATDDPLGHARTELAGVPPAAVERFFAGNGRALLGRAAPPA